MDTPALTHTRSIVEQALLGKGALKFTPDTSWKVVEPIIEDWWNALKGWESQDTFDVAFAEKRMTLRGVGKGGKLNTFRANSTGPMMNLDTSLEGIKARMDPENFEKKKKRVGTRFVWKEIELGKYALGLHDLSGVLLTPDKPWTAQYKNYSEAGTFYVFMPVPQVKDLTVLYLLLDEAKKVKTAVDCTAFLAAITRYRRELTRIKSGAAEDMHTTYVNFGKSGSVKIKYGMTGLIKEEGDLVGVKVPQSEIDQRKVRARNYEGILTDKDVVNEVVIAYRKHGVNGLSNFPMFGIPEAIDTQTKRFAKLRIIDTKKQPTQWVVNEKGNLVVG